MAINTFSKWCFPHSTFLMWVTWHVSSGGARFVKVISTSVLQIATLPSVTYHYFQDMKNDLPPLLANRLILDSTTRQISKKNGYASSRLEILIPSFKK
jgi:hypothetical protein